MDKKLHDVSDMKNTLICCAKSELAKGIGEVDGKELGEVIDMIKDLAQAEYHCMKACYYESVIDAMKEYDDDNDRMGYNHRRYSSGRYAPSGRGHMSGYIPDPKWHHEDMDRFEDEYSKLGRMGYIPTHNMPMMDSRYGKAYNEFQEAKRHYTATNSPTDKAEMDRHMSEHMADTMASVREIWKSADQATRKRFKADFAALMNEMTV